MVVFETYVESATPQKLIASYVIILLGRHRHLKVQFFYNNSTQKSFSARKNHNLQEILKKRFGSDAIGVLAGGEAWYDEEDMIRAGVIAEKGGRYHVLYDDNSPSYSEATNAPPIHEIPDIPLPTFDDLQNGKLRTSLLDQRQEKRVHGYTYFENIPTFTRSIRLRTSDGRSRLLILINKNTEHIDQLLHFLSVYAGDRYIGVKVAEQEFTDDNLMFSSDLVEGEVYQVTYKQPGKLNLLGRAMGKKREVIYSTPVSD